jgi:membrane fusion protein (multidrug efflux system)
MTRIVPCIALAALAVSCSERSGARSGAAGPRAVTVDAAPAEKLPVERTLEAIGTLEASERITVAAEIPGVIRSVHFDEGQRVVPEDEEAPVLFRLDSDLLELEVKQAEASLALAGAEVAEKKAVYERKKKMWEDEAAAEATYVDSKLAFDRGLAMKKQAEATLAIARERLSKAAIRATLAGLVGERKVGPGDYIDAGEPLVELVQVDPLEVSFSLPERYRPLLESGLKVRVRSEAFGDQEAQGTVFFVAPAADPATRSIQLKAKLPNPDWRLKPGVFARVSLVVREAQESIVVPEEAVVPRGDKFYVYTVEPAEASTAAAEAKSPPELASLARRRNVQLGQRIPGKVVVTAGLEGSELVITAGLQKVSDGHPVSVRRGGES